MLISSPLDLSQSGSTSWNLKECDVAITVRGRPTKNIELLKRSVGFPKLLTQLYWNHWYFFSHLPLHAIKARKSKGFFPIIEVKCAVSSNFRHWLCWWTRVPLPSIYWIGVVLTHAIQNNLTKVLKQQRPLLEFSKESRMLINCYFEMKCCWNVLFVYFNN